MRLGQLRTVLETRCDVSQNDYMKATPRRFIRGFSRFRDQAQQGEPVLIEARNGAKFLFHRVGESARPWRCTEPLPPSITATWDLDRPAIAPQEWKMKV